MIRTFYQGDVPIEMWEFISIPIYLIFIFIIASVIKFRNQKKYPEYSFYLWGLTAKVVGGLVFAFFYIYYYQSGDTVAYYESALSTVHLFNVNYHSGVTILFGDRTVEDYFLFSSNTGYPLEFVFHDPKTFMVVRLLVPLLYLSFNSYFICTVLVSVVTYSALWQLYRMFVRYYPRYYKQIAYGVLFMPSTLFWGSGILKDSFTLASTCLFVVSIEVLFLQKKYRLKPMIMVVLSAFLILSIKPYIFMVLLPGAMFWIFYSRIKKIRSKLILYVALPVAFLLVMAGSFFVLSQLGDTLGKFSLDKALDTASISQRDLKRAEYQGNSFDIGDYDPTLIGVASKFPQAVLAGLFRPFLWESNNLTMLLSSMENIVLLGIFVYLLMKVGVKRFFGMIRENPVLLFSVIFAVIFAFVIGISTSNFGALVRFKIPLMPFFTTTMFILLQLYRDSVNLKKRR